MGVAAKKVNQNLPNSGFTALAIIAGVVSHVSENDPTLSFAERMAQKNGGAPVMSELRFRRLLAVRTEEGLFRELRRAVKLADGRLNIVSLADDVFRWCADNQMLAFNKGQDIRPTDLIQVRWSLDYYGARVWQNLVNKKLSTL